VPWAGTGYGVCTKNITKGIKDLGHDVTIFAHWGLKGNVLHWNDIPVFPNDAGDWGMKLAKGIYDRVNADCLITQMDVWILRDHGKNMAWFPYVPIDHDPMPPPVKRQLRTARKAIAMSRFGKRMLDSEGIDSWYIPHGVDTAVFRPDREAGKAVRKFSEWGDRFVVGCVATNKAERKNLRKLMTSFKIFHDRNKDSLLYIHTDATDAEGLPLAGMAKHLGIDESVYFQPKTVDQFNDAQMAALYNAFDVYCMPSKGEGFGIPIIEAQACGVPVIVTDFSAMSELCGSGYLIKKFEREFQPLGSWMADADRDEIVSHLEKCYARPHTVDMKAVEFAKQYDWKVIIEDYWRPVLNEIEDMVKGLCGSFTQTKLSRARKNHCL